MIFLRRWIVWLRKERPQFVACFYMLVFYLYSYSLVAQVRPLVPSISATLEDPITILKFKKKKWVFNPYGIDLTPPQFRPDQLSQFLNAKGIQITEKRDLFRVPQSLIEEQDLWVFDVYGDRGLPHYMVYKGVYFNIYLTPQNLGDFHFTLCSINPIQGYEDLNSEALQELHELMKALPYVMSSFLGEEQGYAIYHNSAKTYSSRSQERHVGVEMIFASTPKYELDIRNQYAIRLYGLCNVAFKKPQQAIMTPLMLMGLKAKIEKVLQEHPWDSEEHLPSIPWTYTVSNAAEARQLALVAGIAALQNQGVIISTEDTPEDRIREKEAQLFPEQNKKLLKKEVEKCAFCDAQVVAEKHVFSLADEHSGVFSVVTNYAPYTKPFHLMIMPEQHIEFFHQLTSRESVTIGKLLQKTLHVMKKREPIRPVVFFIQCWPAGGQTVPHVHIHVLYAPTLEQSLVHLMGAISYTYPDPQEGEDLPPIMNFLKGEKDYAPIREEIRPLLEKETKVPIRPNN